jgi:guanylate kinase/deoxycytidine triphosphate deaminase
LVVTGPSGSGKDSVVRELVSNHTGFARVPAVTTRSPRDGDEPGVYEYVTSGEFQRLRTQDALCVHDEYRGMQYGIKKSSLDAVEVEGTCPVLVLTPKCTPDLAGDWSAREIVRKASSFFSIFLSVPNEELDRRLKEERGLTEDKLREERRRRSSENAAASQCFAEIENHRAPARAAADLLADLWEARNGGGVLSARRIELCRQNGLLIQDGDPHRVSGASYDLSLGDEYFYQGRVIRLSDEEPFLQIQPYDYAIITSHEAANMPSNVAGRFDLSVGLFTQGLILSNGPQIDPGFQGRLFCLVFNTSSSLILLKRRQHYATLEFHQLLEPTYRYQGARGGQHLIDYLPTNASLGAISKLREELDAVRATTDRFHNLVLGFLAILVAFLAFVLSLLFQ